MLANLLVLFGTLILIIALLPVRNLLLQLEKSPMKSGWYSLVALILLFICGYVAFIVQFWDHNLKNDMHDWIVPVVFFSGAVFVWLSCTLALRTAIDLQRMVLLEQESITDSLIGIYNRRYLDLRLAEEVARARRYGRELAVLMIDIDHFKQVNDRYGHQAGDRVLGFLGSLILDIMRQTDIAARYGGEELVIIAPDTPIQTARILAERIRDRIESHRLVLSNEISGRTSIQITVSVGIAGMQGPETTVEQIIACSDRALYEAKESGRNRVVVYEAE